GPLEPGPVHDLDHPLGHLVAEHADGDDLRGQAAHDLPGQGRRDLPRRRGEDEAQGISPHGHGEQGVLLAGGPTDLHEHRNSLRVAAGSDDVTSVSPTSTSSYPASRRRRASSPSGTADSATFTTASGMAAPMRAARAWSTSNVTRSRWLTPTRVAPTARARSSSASSWTSTRASSPRATASWWKAVSSASSRAAAMRSTASAPMARASITSASHTVKSLRNTGSRVAARAAARSPGEPPKNSTSVSTDRHVAPAASYSLARRAGSRSGLRSPLDGERRLTSAMTWN